MARYPFHSPFRRWSRYPGIARAAASPSTDTKSTHSANFFTMWLGIFTNCFSAVLDSSTRTSPVYPNTGNSQALAGRRWRLANALPFSCKPAAEPAPRYYTTSLRRDCQLQRHYGQPSWWTRETARAIRCDYGRRMDNIIPFPIKRTDPLQSILATVRGYYVKAGISETDCDSAIMELRPLLEKYVNDKFESVMDLPASGLTDEQVEMIKSAHNKCVQEIFSHYEQKVGMALCE